jgi:hypothetical protein
MHLPNRPVMMRRGGRISPCPGLSLTNLGLPRATTIARCSLSRTPSLRIGTYLRYFTNWRTPSSGRELRCPLGRSARRDDRHDVPSRPGGVRTGFTVAGDCLATGGRPRRARLAEPAAANHLDSRRLEALAAIARTGGAVRGAELLLAAADHRARRRLGVLVFISKRAAAYDGRNWGSYSRSPTRWRWPSRTRWLFKRSSR